VENPERREKNLGHALLSSSQKRGEGKKDKETPGGES